MRYAVIQNNEVINIIKAEEEFVAKYAEETGYLLVNVETLNCNIGFSYLDGKFSPTVES